MKEAVAHVDIGHWGGWWTEDLRIAVVKEFDQATRSAGGFKKLPERVKAKKKQ